MKIKPENSPVLDAALEAELLLQLLPIEPAPARALALREALFRRLEQPAGLDEFVTIHRDQGEWRRIAPRVLQKRLLEGPGIQAFLLRMEPSSSLPPHDHPTAEECVVLEGEVWLGDVHCEAGDFHRAPRGKPHGALRTNAGCLLYVRTGGG